MAGSTGVSLAMVAASSGCRCRIAMPDDAAAEKAALLQALGADVRRVRPVSITHPGHFVNVARRVGFPSSRQRPCTVTEISYLYFPQHCLYQFSQSGFAACGQNRA